MKINKTQGYQIIQNWMNEKGQKPFSFQEETWDLYAQNFSGLVVAPTGFGKTFSVFLAVINDFLNQPDNFKKGLQLLWVTPLRSLSKDIAKAMQTAINEIGLDWTRLVHGDQKFEIFRPIVAGDCLSTSATIENYRVAAGNEIGAKTGTTSNFSDGWFMGVTQKLVTGVWVGGDDRSIHFRNIQLGQGAKMAMPAFTKFMEKVYSDRSLALDGYQKMPFIKPENLAFDFSCVGGIGGDSTINSSTATALPE